MNVGFIGLGIMGTPMALHLLNAGHQLFVTTRSKLPEAVASTSALRCANAAEVARQADIVFLMLPDTPAWPRRCQRRVPARWWST